MWSFQLSWRCYSGFFINWIEFNIVYIVSWNRYYIGNKTDIGWFSGSRRLCLVVELLITLSGRLKSQWTRPTYLPTAQLQQTWRRCPRFSRCQECSANHNYGVRPRKRANSDHIENRLEFAKQHSVIPWDDMIEIPNSRSLHLIKTFIDPGQNLKRANWRIILLLANNYFREKKLIAELC